MQPFIAALHAMYDQSGIGPRMIWLDEAFGGVDSSNKAAMFRLLTSCDLDWLIAGPAIIANSSTVPLASIYEVRRAPQPLPGVSLRARGVDRERAHPYPHAGSRGSARPGGGIQ